MTLKFFEFLAVAKQTSIKLSAARFMSYRAHTEKISDENNTVRRYSGQ